MKIILLFLTCSILAIPAFSQKPYNKNLKVNDAEFIAGGILFGGGLLSMGIGLLSKTSNVIFQSAVGDNSENTAGNTFLIAGAASMVVGTLLYFDARAKQKKRFALSISSVTYPVYGKGSLLSSNPPALSIIIPFGR